MAGPEPASAVDAALLPSLNATLNAVSLALLVAGRRLAQQKRVREHRRVMLSAFGTLLGLGLAVTVDFLDPTMKDADSVSAAFQITVLAVVPYVKRAEQERLASLPIDSASASMGRRRGLLAFRQGDKRSAARPR